MATLANALKQEITRLARKETKAQLSAIIGLTKASRAEVSRLRKEIATLRKQIKALEKAAPRIPARSVGDEEETIHRFSAIRLRKHRHRLGLSAAELGHILGVSGQSVYHWEQGKTRPRQSQLAAISKLRSLGKRDVATLLENID